MKRLGLIFGIAGFVGVMQDGIKHEESYVFVFFLVLIVWCGGLIAKSIKEKEEKKKEQEETSQLRKMRLAREREQLEQLKLKKNSFK